MVGTPAFKSLGECDLFISGQGGYHTYRIPALVASGKGTILAFCEGRRYSADDAGKIDIVMRRSIDNGRTWQAMQVVVADDGMTCGNPCPVQDRMTGVIWLPFCKNSGEASESLICGGKATRTVWITNSTDEGVTWTEPEEITAQVKRPSWTWYATGPGHGIQLRDGRLVVPCDHVDGRSTDIEQSGHSHIIYSDDHGMSWGIGGIVERGTNECSIVETSDSSLHINCRNYRGAKRRARAWSHDGGLTFTDFGWDETLVEPICQGSTARFGHNAVLFSNPASTGREKLTIRISYDGCRTWASSMLVYDGPSAYSDLAVIHEMEILCLYERGIQQPYEMLSLGRFSIGPLYSMANAIVEG